MEQKKILWIITASGVFLAVVFLFALLICKPNASNNPGIASISPIEKPVVKQETETVPEVVVSQEDIENLDAANDTEEPLEVEPVEVVDANPISKNEDGTVVIDFAQGSGTSAVTAKNETAAQAIENKKQVAKADTIYTSAPSKKAAAEVEAEKQAAALNASGSRPKTVTSVTNYTSSKNTVAAASASTAKTSYVETTRYWVQCAAYTSKKTADQARSKLDENRIPAEVFTYKDAKDNLFYRVRVGPYTTKSEAEYWKNRIAQIDSFKSAQSYITMN